MAIQGIPSYNPVVTSKTTATGARPPAPVPVAQSPVPVAVAAAAQASSAEVVKQIVEALGPVARNLRFSIDDTTGRTVVRVVNPTTDEVIRQIPSEDLLELSRSMDKFVGLFVKDKA